MHVDATTLETLVVNGTYAWFSGWANVNGQQVWFKVEVRDNDHGGSTDWFKITIPSLNYEIGGTLTGGNITIH